MFIGCFLLPLYLCAQQSNVIEWDADKQLNTWLVQQLHVQSALRERNVAQALQSPQTIKTYQEQCRRTYRQLLGHMPEKGPLRDTVTGTLQGDGYRIEKIIYHSFPHHPVTASLYIPDGNGPFPATLLFCGHEPEAKATVSYQQTAALFARNGFVVLMIDPISQGERHQITGKDGKPLTRGGTTEHTLLNAAANLVGTTAAAFELLDNESGLDYLLSRKEVDTTRIGCLGNSGGGTQTAYFMAYESRIKVAAVCSYITTRERTYELSGPLDGCVQLPGEGAAGLEITDYMHMLAPKPLLILAGRYDFVDYTGTIAAYNETLRFYEKLKGHDKIQLVTIDDGHGISAPKREAAVHWFKKWLCKIDAPVTESPVNIFPPAQLNSIITGQVNNSIPEASTVQAYLLQRAEELSAQRKQFLAAHQGIVLKTSIKQLLGIDRPRDSAIVTETGTVTIADLQFRKCLLRSEGEPPLPFLSIQRPTSTPSKVMIYLNDNGKKTLLDSLPQIRSWLEKGYRVILPDLRGTGETADQPAFNHPKYYNREYRNAMTALHIGKPLPGQRVTDLLLLLDYLQTDKTTLPIELTASGMTAVIALHAKAIDDRIHSVHLSDYPHSFVDIMTDITRKDAYSYVIPGVLQYYDIPDLLSIQPATNKTLKGYVDYFNSTDTELVKTYVSNAQAYEWMESNIPLLECPDSIIEKTYYYRWWTFRKHLKQTPDGFIFTEFITPVKHAGRYNALSCALGHHIYEGRWLRDRRYIDEDIQYWYRWDAQQTVPRFHQFSSWAADAVYNRFLVDADSNFVTNLLPAMDADYRLWEQERRLPSGLFWQFDVKDGMEESISGSRKEKHTRPTISSYMYGNANALSKLAIITGNDTLQRRYTQEAAKIRQLVQRELWDDTAFFFKVRLSTNTLSNVREATGYIPWYFNLPEDKPSYANAWKQLTDTSGFDAPWGLTTAERRHPAFRSHGSGGCEWDGPIWPFATTQTLKGLANLLTNYQYHDHITPATYYHVLQVYARSHQKNGLPYLGEYQDERTGYWLKGDDPRSSYYNHSGFCDLVINDLIGLKPRVDHQLELHPLIPAGTWDWFSLTQVPYHGHLLTIRWDKTGKKYNQGKGLQIYVDNREVYNGKELKPVVVSLL
jgi:dienelactone hydrolase/pimeloyl-ACP methyl ester carboxylesterase